jgi:hypothetical protein
MRGITIDLELHPMYIDFLKLDMPLDEKGNIFASERHKIGSLIKILLRRPLKIKCLNIDPDNLITFVLPAYSDINLTSKNHITEKGRRLLASKIRSHFYYSMYWFISDMTRKGSTEIRTNIVLFCEEYEIDDSHYKINTLEVEYRRYRIRTKNGKNIQKITSVLAAFFSIFIHLGVCMLSNAI